MPVPTSGVYRMGSLWAIKPGECWWVVQHRDNSDHGSAQHYFEQEDEAREYAEYVRNHPPSGDHFHPAPKGDLAVRVFFVDRIE